MHPRSFVHKIPVAGFNILSDKLVEGGKQDPICETFAKTIFLNFGVIVNNHYSSHFTRELCVPMNMI